uniref:Olfactory receptor n=1 Tax=Geotrypetes seraphini TaxID=260995 RepID=A0A6P8PWR8_GEOSA|nr:olfactory receptor 1F1-like [Geotrypetes seraphini]
MGFITSLKTPGSGAYSANITGAIFQEDGKSDSCDRIPNSWILRIPKAAAPSLRRLLTPLPDGCAGEPPRYLDTSDECKEMGNDTRAIEFLILGFSEFPELQLLLLILFSLLYLMAVLGNLLIICIVCANQHLHIPMYFFLANLSALDICFLTSIVPKLLAVLKSRNTISFSECILQMYCYLMCVCTEYALLTAMAYDRYVAICNPLRYSIIMNTRVCALLAAASWVIGLLEALPDTVVISQFSFCEFNVIDHVFCELSAVAKLSCSDTSVVDIMAFAEGVLTVITPFILTLISYLFIISNILKIRSTEGKSKAFSTCSSHLTVIILAYGTVIGIYMNPQKEESMKSNKFPIMLYIIILPLLNPIIYSLRNKELKMALKKVIRGKTAFSIH